MPQLLELSAPIDVVTDQTSAHDPLSYLPSGVAFEDWEEYARTEPEEFTARARESMARHVDAMVGFQDAGAAGRRGQAQPGELGLDPPPDLGRIARDLAVGRDRRAGDAGGKAEKSRHDPEG